MTKSEFQEFQRRVFEDIAALTASKGEEYSNSDDQLANFKRSATILGITPEQVWGVLFEKHLNAIQYHVAASKAGGVPPSEPLRGRGLDAILYLILYLALDHERTNLQNLSDAPIERARVARSAP